MTNEIQDAREPRETMLLDSPNGIKAYVHPVRMTIVSLLAEAKKTESEVARLLGVHPANLTGISRPSRKRD